MKTGQPEVGQRVYFKDDEAPHLVTRVEDTTVWYVPVDAIRTTHKGNLVNAKGEQEWSEW